ncbi:MAG: glycosyltransferase family 2 protein [Vampirovibrio sp.]
MSTLPNLRYKKNKYNVGLAGNIFKAMEAASHEYVWILGDDDVYDFTHWQFAEAAMQRQEPVIVIARYDFPEYLVNDKSAQIIQSSFITGTLYKTSHFNDTTMYNAMQSIFTLFPHLTVGLNLFNHEQDLCVVPYGISSCREELGDTDVSYTRGAIRSDVLPRAGLMMWPVGIANITSLVHDKMLASRIMNRGADVICGGEKQLFNILKEMMQKEINWTSLIDVYLVLNKRQRFILMVEYLIPQFFKIQLKNWKNHSRNRFKDWKNRLRNR